MKPQLLPQQKAVENKEVIHWILVRNEEETHLNLEEVVGEPVLECHWLDDANTYIEVQYSNWDGSEFFAIVSREGVLVRKGIREIQEFLCEHDLFIVIMSGLGMGDEAMDYLLAPDDWKWSVINTWGQFVIPPEFGHIHFYTEESFFLVTQRNGTQASLDLEGRPI